MTLNIKNPEVEKLVNEVSRLTGESKTQAIHRALQERRARLEAAGTIEGRAERYLAYLRKEVWAKIPKSLRGKPVSRAERERILGFGPEGF